MSAEVPVIEFEEAGFSHGSVPVFDGVDLALEPGSFQFLVGPSGAGKTTFLRLCSMDLRLTSGSVRHFGKRVSPRNRNAIADMRRRIGVVHQDSRFLDHLPLIENIALPLTLGGVEADERAEDIAALLEWVDLGERVDALPAELSGGERQRAALARAVMLSPDLILADEPTGNVDWEMAQRILTLLIELSRMGKTVLVATHDLNLIRAAKTRVQSRVLRLAGGRIVAAGVDL
jgi:cell division transport system ATP-binding protein